jgi:hypothetical protein
VVTGRATEFVELRGDDETVQGFVRTLDKRKPASGGKVVVTLVRWRGRSGRITNAEALVPPGSSFLVRLDGQRWTAATASYVPTPGLAGCSAPVPRAR